MNRAAEIQASMANIEYELENDIYNPPVLKDEKPFNMSDYIKPVRVTDEDDIDVEKTASENTDELFSIDDDLLSEYTELANELLQGDNESDEYIDECIEQTAKEEDEKMYTEKLRDTNLDNLKENILYSSDKVQGIKDVSKRLTTDNKDIINNVPEVTKDIITYTASNAMPGNSMKKIKSLRRTIEYESEKRKQNKPNQSKNQLLGNLFIKKEVGSKDKKNNDDDKVSYYKSIIANRINRMR